MRISCLLAVCLFLSSGGARAAEPVDYRRDIKPILAEKCYACHSSLKQNAKLRLETAELMRTGGKNGPAIVPGKPAESILFARVTGADGNSRMPPKGEGEHLTASQIALFRAWIEQGAKAPDEPIPPDPKLHWAFVPPTRPALPDVKNTAWGKHPIDRFLTVGHEKHGLTPEVPAERHILLRRVYLDLIGLPPTRDEMRAFLNDKADDAYEGVVDQLLNSPRYGERWGRHWMDIWRYSDWSGEFDNQVRGSPRHTWRWRDWIVESVNQDKGYDRMILEMLAGDEVAPDDANIIRATGFLARNFYRFNRNTWLDDTVEHTAKAFLGLTFGCAKCHDHKFDPVAQEDYYRLRAVFEPHQVRTDPVGGEKNLEKDGLVRVFDKDLTMPTYLFHRGDEKQPVKEKPLTPGVPEVLGGKYDVQPIQFKVNEGMEPASSTGRRLSLAKWLTDRQQPLTARVAVNHMWLRHFSAPLVDNVFDFGLRAEKPPQAALLDWLAVEFMESGWSMKKLHRLMMTSAAYRMKVADQGCSEANRKADRDNRYWWHMNDRRLEAEAIRDSILHLAGNLDTKMGGPEIPLTEGDTSRRRGIYFRHAHERQTQFLSAFDGASALECYRRNITVVPQQALALFNSPLPREQARLLAAQLEKETANSPESDKAFINVAFEGVLSRPPSSAEMERCQRFLVEQAKIVADPKRARENLVHSLFNHSDFITIR